MRMTHTHTRHNATTSVDPMYSITYKVNTNRGDVRLSIGVVCKSKKQTRLSDARVSDQEELEEIIAV